MNTKNPQTAPQPGTSNVQRDPDDWVSGEEPMTGPQASYLRTLCEQSGQSFDGSVSKAEASKRIEALREKVGLADGQPNNEPS